MGLPVHATGVPTAGAWRNDKGSVTGGICTTLQVAGGCPQSTVPPPWLATSPAAPIYPAVMLTFFPLVVKSPESSIPQVGAITVGVPLVVTPTPVPGGPSVYTHPPPPEACPMFVATALARTN